MDDEFSILENEPIARKRLTIFYIIDTSGSMSGEKIGTVNAVMEETLPQIRDIGYADSDIYVTVMTYDTDCVWVYDDPVSIEDIAWRTLDAYGITCMGQAFRELNEKLSRNGFMQSASLSFAPIIFLLSDGYPTDTYQAELGELKKNKWFKHALKIAVAIGRDANRSVLADFTGNDETVITANNGDALTRLIKEITITSSQIGSRSSSFDSEGEMTPEMADQMKQDELVDGIKKLVKPEDLDFDDGW